MVSCLWKRSSPMLCKVLHSARRGNVRSAQHTLYLDAPPVLSMMKCCVVSRGCCRATALQTFWAGLTAGASALLINQRSWGLRSFDAADYRLVCKQWAHVFSDSFCSTVVFFLGTCEALAAIGLMLVLMCALWPPLLTINTEKEMIINTWSCSFLSL